LDFETEAARLHHQPAVLLLSQLVMSGFRVKANGAQLFISPRGLLTAAQCRAIAKCRLELLALVKEVDGICGMLDRMAKEPPGPPMPAELVRQWLLDTEHEYISPQEWLRLRDRGKKIKPATMLD
jgi:hypothetical protein